MVFGCVEPQELLPDWSRDFGRAAPLELEIGPGRGAFALDHAARHPEIDLVAIETRRSDCELIRSRAARRGLRNLIVVQGDAKLLVPRFFPPGALVDFRTDVPNYAREAEQTFRDAGFEPSPDEPPETLSTRERRYQVTG